MTCCWRRQMFGLGQCFVLASLSMSVVLLRTLYRYQLRYSLLSRWWKILVFFSHHHHQGKNSNHYWKNSSMELSKDRYYYHLLTELWSWNVWSTMYKYWKRGSLRLSSSYRALRLIEAWLLVLSCHLFCLEDQHLTRLGKVPSRMIWSCCTPTPSKTGIRLWFILLLGLIHFLHLRPNLCIEDWHLCCVA